MWIAAALAVAVPATAGQASDTPAPPPAMPSAETFSEIPFLSDPVLSPDGKSVAAQTFSDGKTRLTVFDADNPNRAPHVFDIGNHSIADITWAGPHRILLSVGTTMELFGLPLPTSQLVAIDMRTNAVSVVDPKAKSLFAGNILYADPEGA